MVFIFLRLFLVFFFFKSRPKMAQNEVIGLGPICLGRRTDELGVQIHPLSPRQGTSASGYRTGSWGNPTPRWGGARSGLPCLKGCKWLPYS